MCEPSNVLGVITAVDLYCPPRSIAQNTCLLAVKDFQRALDVLQSAKKYLGEILSAVEFMDTVIYHMPFAFFTELQNPLEHSQDHVILLVETSGSNDDHDKEKLNAFLEVIRSFTCASRQDLYNCRRFYWTVR